MRCQLCAREGKAKPQKFPVAVFRNFKKEDGSNERRLIGYVCRVCIRTGKLARKAAQRVQRLPIPIAAQLQNNIPSLGAI